MRKAQKRQGRGQAEATRRDGAGGQQQATGGCLCGSVRYTVRGPLRPVVNCHCGQCRKFHGHFGAYSAAPRQNIAIAGEAQLSWYVSSQIARRGFCSFCGSSLFWDGFDEREMSIAAGTLDGPTGLKTVRHIFVADKGDYYEIADRLEQLPGTMREGPTRRR